MLITAQLDRSSERREFDGTRRRARNIEEELVGLGVKVHVVLRCTAVWTVIREVAVLRVLEAARRVAHLYARCRWAGITPRSANDCLIATHAIFAGVPLLHHDRDFNLIAGVEPNLTLVVAQN